jgi:putative RNA 2'-phosphotransferase
VAPRRRWTDGTVLTRRLDVTPMTDAVRRCEVHGYVAGSACPVCGDAGERVLTGERRRRLSKFCSGALRHFPGDAGLELDDAGWTPLSALVAAVESTYDWATGEHVDAVVATDPKGRFERHERDGTRMVRAAYGHSVEVDLEARETPVPDALYHGTDPANVDAILREGLRPMGRQQVHLSGSVERAREVGSRHADDPVVLAVDVAALQADDHAVTKRGRSVYTTDRVPPAYLDVVAE